MVDAKTATEAMIRFKEDGRLKDRSRASDPQWSEAEIEMFKTLPPDLPRLRLPSPIDQAPDDTLKPL